MTAPAPTTPSPPRRGRPALGALRLSRRSIIATALDLIDEHGAAELSMRSIARALSVDAKSLYNHFRDKEDLLDAVAETMLSSIDVHRPTGDLDADLAGIAHAFRNMALQHPRAATLVLTRQVNSPAALAPTESILAVLLDAGFGSAEAAHLLRTLLATLVGTLLREFEATPTFITSDDEAITRRAAALAQCGLPAVQSVAAELARFDAEAEFRFMIDASTAIVRTRMPRSA